jgi:hypothetical protein
MLTHNNRSQQTASEDEAQEPGRHRPRRGVLDWIE